MEALIGIMVLAMMAVTVLGIVIACRAAFNALSKPNLTRYFEKYKHHGEGLVWVRTDLKGKHRDHCLCYNCKKFHPGSEGNCPVAQRLYEVCVEHDLVTPVWECPAFAQDPFADERK